MQMAQRALLHAWSLCWTSFAAQQVLTKLQAALLSWAGHRRRAPARLLPSYFLQHGPALRKDVCPLCSSSPLSKAFFTTDSLCWKAGGRFYLGWNHFKALFWWSVHMAFNLRQHRDRVKQPKLPNWNLSNISRGTDNLSRCYNIHVYLKTIIWVIRTVPDTLVQIAPDSPQKSDSPLHKWDCSPSQNLQKRTQLTKMVSFFSSLFFWPVVYILIWWVCVQLVSLLQWWWVSLLSSIRCHRDTGTASCSLAGASMLIPSSTAW